MPDEIQGGEVAPVETAVVETAPVTQPESAQEPAESQADETASADGEQEKPVEKSFTQAELDEILAKKTAKLTRLRDQERSKREALEQELVKASMNRSEGRPTQDQYPDADAYADAVADWKLGQRDRAEQAVQQHKSTSTFESRAAEFMAELGDMDGFDEAKFRNEISISDAMAKAMVDSDVGVKVAQHLYSHPEESRRIFALAPERQAAEIGKLEVKLSTAPKLSKAPEPITPISKGNASTSRALADLSMEDYIAERKKQGARWAR